ncbi:MAG TPA: hypothetical protein VJV39_01365 [Dongiaceae bacterium]|nr:hypothetical protein [Dongiaceae bacterium]
MRNFSTLILSAALGCGVLVGAAPARALDYEDFWVKQRGLEAKHPQIRVAFDLQKDTWSTVTNDEVVFEFEWHVKLQKSYALAPGSTFAMTIDNASWEKPLQSSDLGTETFGDIFKVKKQGSKLGKLKDYALYVCGEIRNNHGKPNKDHVLTKYIQGTGWLDVSTIAPGYNVLEKDIPVWVTYDIVCMANPKWHEPIQPKENNLAVDKGDFKVQSIDVFLTTFQGQETSPTPGTSCKKLKVTVRIETNKAGIVAYKLWRQPGEAVEKSHMATMKKDGQFKGRFIVEDTFVDTFDKTTYIQYMAEVTNLKFGPSTQWKPITIQCNGGFTTGQPQGGAGDLIPSFKVTKTDLKIISLEGKGCPTKAFVTATFIANKPGTFKYFIGTSLNKNKSGQLEAKKVGNVYRAQETLTVDITKSGKLTAHARPVDFPAAGTATSKAYNCTGVNPVGGVTTQ